MTEFPDSDVCPASRHLQTGRSDGPWYTTLMPFEHFDSQRSQQFPHSCDSAQLAGLGPITVGTRTAPGSYPKPYNLVTRERNELFIYGGYINQIGGAYVAKLDPDTLQERWRVNWSIDDPNFFDWPGVAGVHGNGFVYAVAGNILARIDPETGDNRTIRLPEHPGAGGAAYNGFVISNKGFLIAKSLKRGGTEFNSQAGLQEVAANGVPSILVAVDPASLKIVAQIEAPGPVLGRVTTACHNGEEYVYMPGLTNLWRYRFTGTEFIRDVEWSPVYADAVAGEKPGTACGLLNGWVIIQTNFLRSHTPLRISAFHVEDCHRRHTIVPFPESKHSQEFSKPALDAATMRVYTNDQAAHWVAGLNFDPDAGFSVNWKEKQTMASFWAVVGPENGRNIIGTDFTQAGDHVLWRNAETGEELARSDTLDAKPNGNIVSTGFDGRFYYLGIDSGKVIELQLASSPA